MVDMSTTSFNRATDSDLRGTATTDTSVLATLSGEILPSPSWMRDALRRSGVSRLTGKPKVEPLTSVKRRFLYVWEIGDPETVPAIKSFIVL
jgi:hypothetical protein